MGLSKSGSGLGPTAERFSGDYAVWSNVISPEFNKKADVWLKDLKLKNLEQYLLDRNETTASLAKIKHWVSELFEPEVTQVIEDLVIDVELLGEAINIEESTLGKTLIEALKMAKIEWRWASQVDPENVWQMDSLEFPSLPQFPDKTRLEVFHDAEEKSSVLQYVRIHKNKRGQEVALWFGQQVVATRPMHQITHWWANDPDTGKLWSDQVPLADLGKVLNFGEWSEQISLTALFKKLIFLAEAGAEAVSDAPGTRAKKFKHLESATLPKPVAFFDKDTYVASTWESDDGDGMYSIEKFPHVANLGWIIRDTEAASLAKTFTILKGGLIRVQYALCDGFATGWKHNWSGSWDVNTLSGSLTVAPEQKTKVNGAAFWVPNTLVGLEAAAIRGSYSNLYNGTLEGTARRATAENIVSKGSGAASINGINTYVFDYLLPEQDTTLALRILELAVLANQRGQSINAISNTGVALYVARDLEGAEEKFNQVLKHAERTNDNEAYFYLAALARIRGDETAAKDFDKKCAKAGGYESPLFAQADEIAEAPKLRLEDLEDEVPGSTLTKSSGGGLGVTVNESSQENRASFCTQCGHKFENSEDNYCTECGAKRQ